MFSFVLTGLSSHDGHVAWVKRSIDHIRFEACVIYMLYLEIIQTLEIHLFYGTMLAVLQNDWVSISVSQDLDQSENTNQITLEMLGANCLGMPSHQILQLTDFDENSIRQCVFNSI